MEKEEEMSDFYDYQVEFFKRILCSDKPMKFIARRWAGKEEYYRILDESRQLQKIMAEDEEE